MLPASGRIVPPNWNTGKKKTGDAQVKGASPIQGDAVPRLLQQRLVRDQSDSVESGPLMPMMSSLLRSCALKCVKLNRKQPLIRNGSTASLAFSAVGSPSKSFQIRLLLSRV